MFDIDSHASAPHEVHLSVRLWLSRAGSEPVSQTIDKYMARRLMQIRHVQDTGSATVSRRGLDLTASASLAHFAATNVELSGTLTLPESLEVLDVRSSTIRHLQLPDAPRMHTIRVANASLSGPVSKQLLESEGLTQLDLAGNGLTSMPASWTAPDLQVLTLSGNRIQVRASWRVCICKLRLILLLTSSCGSRLASRPLVDGQDPLRQRAPCALRDCAVSVGPGCACLSCQGNGNARC